MMFDLLTVTKYAKALRIVCEARAKDRDDATAEASAIIFIKAVAEGMGTKIERDPERAPRWIGTELLARDMEAAAHALADTREGTFDQIGAIVNLSIRFGAIASRLGFQVLDVDDAARWAVEGERSAAE